MIETRKRESSEIPPAHHIWAGLIVCTRHFSPFLLGLFQAQVAAHTSLTEYMRQNTTTWIFFLKSDKCNMLYVATENSLLMLSRDRYSHFIVTDIFKIVWYAVESKIICSNFAIFLLFLKYARWWMVRLEGLGKLQCDLWRRIADSKSHLYQSSSYS